eukprot:gene2465-2805_t
MIKKFLSLRTSKSDQKTINSGKGDTMQSKLTTSHHDAANKLASPEYEAGSPLYVSVYMEMEELPVSLYVGGDKIEGSTTLCVNPHLLTLILDFNKFKSIPPTITAFPNLTELSIASNLITELPLVLAELKSLQILQVGLNPLTTFPMVVCSIPSLTSLHLESNLIDTIPTDILNLVNLKRIGYPSLIESLAANLTWLNLSENQLTTIDPSFVHLVNMKVLMLDCNMIMELPDTIITGWKSIETLNMPHNFLRTLPPEIILLSTLKVIDIRANRFDIVKSVSPEVSAFGTFKLEDFVVDKESLELVRVTHQLAVQLRDFDKSFSDLSSLDKLDPIIIWQSTYPDQIIEGLYLGCRECSINKSWLLDHNSLFMKDAKRVVYWFTAELVFLGRLQPSL